MEEEKIESSKEVLMKVRRILQVPEGTSIIKYVEKAKDFEELAKKKDEEISALMKIIKDVREVVNYNM